MEKQISVRILNKIDNIANWEKVTNFTPMNGELIIINNGDGLVPDFKVGDGQTLFQNLPLIDNELPHASKTNYGTTILNAGGAAPYDHDHDNVYLRLIGDTMKGELRLPTLKDTEGNDIILGEDTIAATRGFVSAQISDLVGGMKYLGVTTTPLENNATTSLISVDGKDITPAAGNVVIYDGTQYIWNANSDEPHWDLISTSSADTTYFFNGSYNEDGVWVGILTSSTGGVVGNIAPPVFVGATTENAGKAGLVPPPAAAQDRRFLRGDGTWANVDASSIEALPANTNYAGSNTPGGPAMRLAHKITFGANENYTFDGSADLIVPVYMGSII